MLISAGRHTIVPDDIDCFVKLEFGAFCSIASGLRVVSGQHPGVAAPSAISHFPFYEHRWGKYPPCHEDGGVVVGSDVWIGQGVTLLDGVQVGHGAVLAAAAVVVKDVPPFTVVAGNPGIVKKARFDSETIERLLAIAWWEWPDDEIEAALPTMADVERFLAIYGS